MDYAGEHKVVVGRPPNFDEIAQVFPLARRSTTIFAYGDTIFISNDTVILPPQLIAHERVHLARQSELGAEEWWNRYLADTKFRYEEELLAHRAEYRVMTSAEASRNIRRSAGRTVAKRLTAPLYKFSVSKHQAYKDITGMYDE